MARWWCQTLCWPKGVGRTLFHVGVASLSIGIAQKERRGKVMGLGSDSSLVEYSARGKSVLGPHLNPISNHSFSKYIISSYGLG